MRTSDELDPDLVELLHRAADTIPGYGADLAMVVRRRRARQQRQVLVAGFAAVAAAAVLAAGVVLVRPNSRPDTRPAPPRPSPTVAAHPSPPRLFLSPVGAYTVIDGKDVGLGGGAGLDEVLRNGQVVTLKVPGLSGIANAVALPDGGVAAVGAPSASPSAAGTPDPSQSAGDDPSALTLAVLRPDGSLRLLRAPMNNDMVGADTQEVYIYANKQTIGIDLNTGRQRTMPWGADFPAAVGGGHVIDLISDAPAPQQKTCTVRVLDAASGARVSDASIPAGDCDRYGDSLSPDGKLLAIVQPPGTNARSNQMVLVVVNVTTGKELVHQALDDVPFGHGVDGQLMFGGVCWSDPDHVWAAWSRLPTPAVRIYTMAETLRQAVVPVPGR
jgi:hypothetical protein